ncbi:MAG TPA: hypothetical protein VGX52_11415 [Burkholderiales bacterium]|nr:hypothetical protein [Burkholderiales bacterium]
MKWFVPLVVLIAGCSGHTHSSVSFSSVSTHSGVHAHIEGGSGVAALLGLSILAAAVVETERGRYSTGSTFGTRYDPEMAADRRISEQDCTKPLDYSLGNIRCK